MFRDGKGLHYIPWYGIVLERENDGDG